VSLFLALSSLVFSAMFPLNRAGTSLYTLSEAIDLYVGSFYVCPFLLAMRNIDFSLVKC
jgi:hypothetical protein